MSVYLHIVKPQTEEYFDLNKGFSFIKGIAGDNPWDKPKKLDMSFEQFKQAIKEAMDYDNAVWTKILYKIARPLYEWIGDDKIYQIYDVAMSGEELDYKCIGDRFDLFDYKEDED